MPDIHGDSVRLHITLPPEVYDILMEYMTRNHEINYSPIIRRLIVENLRTPEGTYKENNHAS